jgi:serine/threonine-protein kinase
LVANGGAGTVTEINAGSGQVTGTIKVGDHPDGINSAAGAIWVANPDNNAVTRINAASGTPVGTPIRVGMDPRRVVANQVRVWVANAGDGTVTRIDAATGRILGTIRVGGHPDVMTIVGNTVWVASWSQPNVAPKGVPGTVTRIEESSGKVLAASARH